MPFFIAGTILYALAGCSNSSDNKTYVQTAQKESVTAKEAAEPEKSVADTVFLNIEGNDQLQYNKNELEVYEEQVVVLTLKHVGKMNIESMGHNWILLTKGTDIPSFGQAAAQAKENNYLPSEMTGQIIAKTDMIGGGEETSVTFQAPSKGNYKFICSFPGHYGTMQGTFVVLPG